MRTMKQMAIQKEKQRKARLLSFKEFCDYVYEPTQMLKKLNLPEDQRREIEEGIEAGKSLPETLDFRISTPAK